MRKDIYDKLNDKLGDSNIEELNKPTDEEQQLLKLQELRELEQQYHESQKYIDLEESNNNGLIQTIISDNNKLALVLFFGVSIYALYVLSKQNNK